MTRTDLINLLIKKYKLSSYLEIGVRDSENFNKINCKLKRSVDPNWPADYSMTSDRFFNSYRGFYYDIVFIDGLHTEEQVYKDVMNTLDMISPQFIIMHDCNPQTKWHTRPPEEYTDGEWNGTVYRAFIRLKRELPSWSCFVVDTDYGCGVLTMHDILDNKVFNNDWEYFDTNRVELLQLISVDNYLKLI